MTAAETEARLREAARIVEAAGAIALEHFRRPIRVDNKLDDGGFDPVTAADRGVEAAIRGAIAARWPDDPVMGEEDGFTPGTSVWSWIIDPIDGTRAFISGLPAWGILLGLLHDGRPVGGLMRQPYLEETFIGGPGGAWLIRRGRETPLHTSGRTAIGDAILYSTHPDMFAGAEAKAGFDRVATAVRMTRFGGDCYSYCLLAHGLVDLVIESGLQAYDIVPLIPIVEAAGGVVTGPDGASPLAGGTVIAASNPDLHAATLALMRGA